MKNSFLLIIFLSIFLNNGCSSSVRESGLSFQKKNILLNPKWSFKKIDSDKEIVLSVEADDFAKEVTFLIYEKKPDGTSEFIASIDGKVTNGTAKAGWIYKCHDFKHKHLYLPHFYFVAEEKSRFFKIASDSLEISSWIELDLRDEFDKKLSNQKILLKSEYDGKLIHQKECTTDQNGFAKCEGLLPCMKYYIDKIVP